MKKLNVLAFALIMAASGNVYAAGPNIFERFMSLFGAPTPPPSSGVDPIQNVPSNTPIPKQPVIKAQQIPGPYSADGDLRSVTGNGNTAVQSSQGGGITTGTVVGGAAAAAALAAVATKQNTTAATATVSATTP